MKDDIFGNARAGVAFDTGALEKIFETVLGCGSLNDVKYPRFAGNLVAVVEEQVTAYMSNQ